MGKTQEAIDRAVAEITRSTTVQDGAEKLIRVIVASARENAGDPAALNAAMDGFVAEINELSTAVEENTQPTPPPPPDPLSKKR